MGIRSDVILCIKNEAYVSLSDESKATIKDWLGDYEERDEEGMLFYTEGVKWYHDMSPDLIALYADLVNEDEGLEVRDGDDFLVIVACSEYPNDTEGDIGDWHDNPWGAHKCTSVTAEWSR